MMRDSASFGFAVGRAARAAKVAKRRMVIFMVGLSRAWCAARTGGEPAEKQPPVVHAGEVDWLHLLILGALVVWPSLRRSLGSYLARTPSAKWSRGLTVVPAES